MEKVVATFCKRGFCNLCSNCIHWNDGDDSYVSSSCRECKAKTFLLDHPYNFLKKRKRYVYK